MQRSLWILGGIALKGAYVTPTENNAQPFHLMRSDGKQYYWRHYQPYGDGENIIYVATRRFDEAQKATPPSPMVGSKPVIGYVRMVQPANIFIPKSTPARNRWFTFNGAPDMLDWGDAVAGQKIPTTYFIDLEISASSVVSLPERMPEIANNHLDYMLTWYSFIVILLTIYLMLHRRADRLNIEKKS